MAAIVKIYSTTASKLPQLPIVDGTLTFVKDTRRIYLDMNGVRVEYSVIQVLQDENARTGLLAPVEGFYFVEDTSVMWRYKAGWKQMTPSNLEPVFMGSTTEDFPQTGKSSTLYVAEDAMYRWNSSTRSYDMVSNATVWSSISE